MWTRGVLYSTTSDTSRKKLRVNFSVFNIYVHTVHTQLGGRRESNRVYNRVLPRFARVVVKVISTEH